MERRGELCAGVYAPRAHLWSWRRFSASAKSRQPVLLIAEVRPAALIAFPLGTKSQVFAEAYSSSENFEASLDRRLNEGRAGLSRACEDQALGSSLAMCSSGARRRPPSACLRRLFSLRSAVLLMKSACFRSLSSTCNRPVTFGDPSRLSPIPRVHTLSPSSWAPSAGVTATRIHLRVTKQTFLS